MPRKGGKGNIARWYLILLMEALKKDKWVKITMSSFYVMNQRRGMRYSHPQNSNDNTSYSSTSWFHGNYLQEQDGWWCEEPKGIFGTAYKIYIYTYYIYVCIYIIQNKDYNMKSLKKNHSKVKQQYIHDKYILIKKSSLSQLTM